MSQGRMTGIILIDPQGFYRWRLGRPSRGEEQLFLRNLTTASRTHGERKEKRRNDAATVLGVC